jgi:hypothetical protein
MPSQLCKTGRIEKLWRCHQVNPVQKFGQLGLSHTLCQHYHKHRSVEDDPVSLYQERRAQVGGAYVIFPRGIFKKYSPVELSHIINSSDPVINRAIVKN